MTDERAEQILKDLAFGRHLSEKTLVELSRICESRAFPPGAVLFREGQQHELIYLIVSGAIALDMRVPGRGDVRVLSLGQGDVLGWSPLVGNSLMSASATVVADAAALVLPGKPLRQICEADHEVGYYVMSAMTAALSRRLVASRLLLLVLFADTSPVHAPRD